MDRTNTLGFLTSARDALVDERDRLGVCIESLEGLIAEMKGTVVVVAQEPQVRQRKKPVWTNAARAAAKERMQKYWSARKKAEKKGAT